MLYTKERLQELYKESRRRHGIIEIRFKDFTFVHILPKKRKKKEKKDE